MNEITIVEGKIYEAQQLDELNWQDVKKGAGNALAKTKQGTQWAGKQLSKVPGAIQQGAKAVEKGANAYTQGVTQTGNALAGAANAVGRAGAETFKQGVARPVSGVWNAGKDIAQKATGAVQQGYGDVKQGVQTVGKGVSTAQTDLGNAAKFAGNTAAKALGGAGKTVGAVASAPQGAARAVKRGYQAGVNAVGGASDQELAYQARQAKRDQQAKQGQQSPSYAMPGTTAPSSVSYGNMPAGRPSAMDAPASQGNIQQALSAVKSLDKLGKKQVHQQLEKELYGNRSDSGRRELGRVKPSLKVS